MYQQPCAWGHPRDARLYAGDLGSRSVQGAPAGGKGGGAGRRGRRSAGVGRVVAGRRGWSSGDAVSRRPAALCRECERKEASREEGGVGGGQAAGPTLMLFFSFCWSKGLNSPRLHGYRFVMIFFICDKIKTSQIKGFLVVLKNEE